MIDIVIPLGKGSRHDNFELRYSLRSIEKYAKGYRSIFIVGEWPEWLENCTYIPHEDRYNHERNIYEKIKRACLAGDVSQEFVFWNDDFFLLDEVDLSSYPCYYFRDLHSQIQKRGPYDGYRHSLQNSLNVLEKGKYPIRNYDIHCPIRYDKRLFLETVGSLDWSIGNGYVIKSLYANMNHRLDYVSMPDLKLHTVPTVRQVLESVKGRHIFSTTDRALDSAVKQFIESIYPEKSRFEK